MRQHGDDGSAQREDRRQARLGFVVRGSMTYIVTERPDDAVR